VRPDDGWLGTLRVLAGAEATRGRYFAFVSETAPAATPGALDVHTHTVYDESEYVLSGTREIVIDDEQWRATAGFFALAPRHAQHGMRTIGTLPSRWLHIFSPAGIETYFRERERLREQGASAEELRALSARHSVSAVSDERTTRADSIAAGVAGPDGLIVTGQATRNAYALAERSALPEHDHTHADQEEAFYVIAGELTVEAAGSSVTVPADSFVLVPRGLPHRHLVGPGTRLLAVSSPGHAVLH
jgi:quercetin dioxygenase-like cupin family protein